MKPSHTIRPVFDDPNLVSAAGLVPALRLAESAGFYDLVKQLSVPSPNAAAKTACVVGGMLAGADSIDDLGFLRHGGMPRLFAGVRAPSTLGTFLRSFTHGQWEWIAWDTKTSWSWSGSLDTSTPHREVFTHLRHQIVSSQDLDQRAWASELIWSDPCP